MALVVTHIIHEDTQPVATVPSEITSLRTSSTVAPANGGPSWLKTSVVHDDAEPIPAGVEERRWTTGITPGQQSKIATREQIRGAIIQLEADADAFDAMNNTQKQNALLARGGDLLRNDAKLARLILDQF